MAAVVDCTLSSDAVEVAPVPAVDCSTVDAGLADSVDVCKLELFSVGIKGGVLVATVSVLVDGAAVDVLEA